MDYNMDNINHIDNDVYSVSLDDKKAIMEAKKMDRGYNCIYRMVPNKKGVLKKTPIDVYTSGGPNSNIRDAETGQYYSNLVGSLDEDLFFKVIVATGECRSKNGSNTLFYLSPRHYMSHMNCELDEEIIDNWNIKRESRLRNIELKKQNILSLEVR